MLVVTGAVLAMLLHPLAGAGVAVIGAVFAHRLLGSRLRNALLILAVVGVALFVLGSSSTQRL